MKSFGPAKSSFKLEMYEDLACKGPVSSLLKSSGFISYNLFFSSSANVEN